MKCLVVSTWSRNRNCSGVVLCMGRLWTCKLCCRIAMRGCEDRGEDGGMHVSRSVNGEKEVRKYSGTWLLFLLSMPFAVVIQYIRSSLILDAIIIVPWSIE
jgi:hypothetical protein